MKNVKRQKQNQKYKQYYQKIQDIFMTLGMEKAFLQVI